MKIWYGKLCAVLKLPEGKGLSLLETLIIMMVSGVKR